MSDNNANRSFKDSAFTCLFSDSKNLISLYNALENKNYPLDTEIEINTLDEVFFRKQKNDISFIIDNRFIVLIEHQSTINGNMPLRLLIYIARLYEKMFAGKAIYKERTIPLPTPEFIVLYNGTKKFAKEKIYKLSDAFIDKCQGIHLDLTVRVVNANYGQNNDIMRKCTALNEYSIFIDKIRRLQEQGETLDVALKHAINYCIDHEILKDFLIRYSSEVRNMLYQEFNIEDAIEVAKEEGIEEGFERGIEQGIEKGIEQGIEKGQQQIIESMYSQGISREIIEAVLNRAKS